MGILIYSGKHNVLSDRLRGVIEHRCRDRAIEHYTGIRQLSERLHMPVYDVEAAVLMATSKRDLDDLLSNEDVISSLQVILILPATDHEAVSKAHRLRPRFVTSPQHGFADLVLVLEKILERAERLRTQEAV